MGRVARYKKIKSCDPYSKKNKGNVNLNAVGVWGYGDSGRKAKKRSLKAQMMRKAKKRSRFNGDEGGGFDLPPTTHKDEFDLRDLTGSIKKQKLENPLLQHHQLQQLGSESTKTKDKISTETIKVDGENVVATIPKTDADERKVARVLNVEKTLKEDMKKQQTEAGTRQLGESKNAYSKRTKSETRQIIKQSKQTVNEEKRQKKRDFLKNKKLKKRKKKNNILNSNNDDDYNNTSENNNDNQDDGFVTGERAVAAVMEEDYVRFGEQAERPPSFRQLPRGAKQSQKKSNSSTNFNNAATTTKGMTPKEVHAEQDAMETLRRRVQAQYSVIKAQRRRAGDFHL